MCTLLLKSRTVVDLTFFLIEPCQCRIQIWDGGGLDGFGRLGQYAWLGGDFGCKLRPQAEGWGQSHTNL